MIKRNHLVILQKPYLDAIVSGRKIIESRFTKMRRAPFGQIASGDRLFLKISSGPVCATAEVKRVELFDNLTPGRIAQLKDQYNKHILGSDLYWQSKSVSRFGILVWLCNVHPMKPVSITKKDWRAWVVLTSQNNYGLI